MNYETFILGCGFAEDSLFGNLIVGNGHSEYDNKHRAIMGIMDQWYKFAKHDNQLEDFVCCGAPRASKSHNFCPMCAQPYVGVSPPDADAEIREAAAASFHEILSEGFTMNAMGSTYDFFDQDGWELQATLTPGGVISIQKFDQFLELGFHGAVERFARNGEWGRETVQVFDIATPQHVEYPTLRDIVPRNAL